MVQEVIINKNLFKAQSLDELFEEHTIDLDLAMKIQALPTLNIVDGLVDMGDTRLLPIDEFIKTEFKDDTVLDILRTILKMREIRLINEREVKQKMRFIRAVCISQVAENEDGTKNVFMTPEETVDFLNARLEKENQNFRVSVDRYKDPKYLDSVVLFDEETATYFFNVSEVKESMTEEEHEKLWKGAADTTASGE